MIRILLVLAALLLLPATVEARCGSTCRDDYKQKEAARVESNRAAAEQRARERAQTDITSNGLPSIPGSGGGRSTLQDEVDALTRRIRTLEDDQ